MTDELARKMAGDLQRVLENVVDEPTFLGFVAALAADWEKEREIEAASSKSWHASGALGWENGTIGAFLEASFQWGDSSGGGLGLYEVPENSWRRVADILFAGKIYEQRIKIMISSNEESERNKKIPAVVFACLRAGEFRILLHPANGFVNGGAPFDVPSDLIPSDLRIPNASLWVALDEKMNIVQIWRRE